ncbi:MAG: NADH-quinone oxidoreductase subunit NuoG, partial [Gammaproteobacteria bacterium]|nr:NADH-quinone oxidoreductase subunit NuoG [Gammaproteobacteria bacterium]
CLVDVEKAPKPLPACATPVMDGMKVYTQSRRAIDAQHGVMEFLLINHPLDCPICDQGGECELQDLAMGYGRSVSRFTERKRVVKDKNAGPLIQTDMTRCIHCTRCVRFLEEIAGTSEMGGSGRGDNLEIGTCIERSIDSELSGNIIDLCPVGALTNKPFRYSARSWEMRSHRSVAAHDGVGSSLHYHTRRGDIMRAVPAESEMTNETWLSDRDRYSHFGLYSKDRVMAPRIKLDGQWRDVSWEQGVSATAEALGAAREAHGGEQIGFLMSPSCTSEEYYLAAKLARALECENIDYRLREIDFSDHAVRQQYALFEKKIGEIEHCDAILLVGSNIRHEAPILGHRVRKAWQSGAQISAVNPLDWNFHFDLESAVICAPQQWVSELAKVAKSIENDGRASIPDELKALIPGGEPGAEHQSIAKQLKESEHGLVICGQAAMAHPSASALRQLARWIAKSTGCALNLLPHGANTTGAAHFGALPGEAGLDVRAMLDQARKTYVLWGIEPDFDIANPALAQAALDAADTVIAVASHATPQLESVADVILPLAPIAESDGSFENLDGTTLSFSAAGKVRGEARPGWKILRRIGAVIDAQGFSQVNIAEVQAEMAGEEDRKPGADDSWPKFNKPRSAKGLHRVGETPMYGVDALCRRSDALQATAHADSGFVGLNPKDGKDLGLAHGDKTAVDQGGEAIELEVRLSEEVPQGAAWLRTSTCVSRALGDSFGSINISAGGGAG